jgi:hypothetical protein
VCVGRRKGWAGFFQLVNGFTVLFLGLSIALGDRFSKWLGWVGVAAGIGFAGGGTATAHTGFSSSAGLFLAPATVLLTVFLLGLAIQMWRRSANR